MLKTSINAGLTLTEYREGIRFGTDALLLASFAGERCRSGKIADFGTGSGVLPLLLLASGSRAHFTAVEIQEKYAALARENAAENGFSDRMRVLCGDLRRPRELFAAGEMDHVISNPPYLPTECGRKNLAPEKRIAWHEDCLSVTELCAAAAWALRSGGRFTCVYLPSRFASLVAALRANALEPKRLQWIAPDVSAKPSLLLLEAKKDAAEGLEVLPTLYLYADASHQTQSASLQELLRSF